MRRNTSWLLMMSLLLCCCTAPAVAEESALPERRKIQFLTDPGYYVFPTPYSIPGIGEGGALIGLANNIAGTYTDSFVFLLGGDVSGLGFGLTDVHILPKRLILDVFARTSMP